mgnify:CR=1 FL=1
MQIRQRDKIDWSLWAVSFFTAQFLTLIGLSLTGLAAINFTVIGFIFDIFACSAMFELKK